MLVSISYVCKKCGIDYAYIHYVDNNELLEKLKGLQQRCSECNSTVDADIQEIKSPYLRVEGDRVYFLNKEVMRIFDDQMDIQFENLMNTGFCGTVNLLYRNDRDEIKVNPLYKKISHSPLKKSRINKIARHRPILNAAPQRATEVRNVDANIPPIMIDRETRDAQAEALFRMRMRE